MSDTNEITDATARPRRQFSLRFLFKLTLLVAILLTIGVLFSPWTAVTITIPLAVWFVDRAQLITPRWLAIASLGLFGVSLGLPAIEVHLSSTLWRTDHVVWGWQAFMTSFLVIPEILRGQWPWNEPDETDFAFAYLFGAAANSAFLLGFLAYGWSAKMPRYRTFARRAAILACFLVVADLAVLLYTDELRDIYPGFGFWLASMLALALGTRRYLGQAVPDECSTSGTA